MRHVDCKGDEVGNEALAMQALELQFALVCQLCSSPHLFKAPGIRHCRAGPFRSGKDAFAEPFKQGIFKVARVSDYSLHWFGLILGVVSQLPVWERARNFSSQLVSHDFEDPA